MEYEFANDHVDKWIYLTEMQKAYNWLSYQQSRLATLEKYISMLDQGELPDEVVRRMRLDFKKSEKEQNEYLKRLKQVEEL